MKMQNNINSLNKLSTSLFELLSQNELNEIFLKIPSNETPLWKYWSEFVEKYLRTGKSEITVKNVRDALKFIIRHAHIYSIEACNNTRLLEDTLFTLKAKRKLSNVTYNSYLKNLNTYFIWLTKKDYISQNNIKKVDRCKEEQNEQLILSNEQVQGVIAQVHTRRQTNLERLRNELFIDLLKLTGARPCELLSLQVKDFRPSGNTYQLVIKGRKQKGKPRHYNIPSYVKHTFEAYIDYRTKFRPDETNLFISSSKRSGWTGKGMRGLFRGLSKELGFKLTAYSFRRYVATTLNAAHLPITDIMNHLGHTRPTTTFRYIQRSGFLTQGGVDIMAKT